MSFAVEWFVSYIAQVSLTDAAMCMNLINESLFNIVMLYVFFSHCDFLLSKPNCISYAWLEIFGRGC